MALVLYSENQNNYTPSDIFGDFYRPRSEGDNALGSVRPFVCLGVPRAPLHRYLGYLCTRKAQYAPLRRNMHHGAQGRLCFLKNSGVHKYLNGSHCYNYFWVHKYVSYVWKIGGVKGALIPLRVAHKEHTSVWVICRLSPYVCVCVTTLTAEWTDVQTWILHGGQVEGYLGHVCRSRS